MRRVLLRVLACLSAQLARAGRLLGYAFAGVLRHAELQARLQAAWDEYGDRHARSGWAGLTSLSEWEKEFYLAHLRPGQSLLLVGCGTGRDLIGLIEHGLRADGLDIAKRAVDSCRVRLRERGLSARLFDCAVEDARLEGSYSAAVFTWLAYGYVAESRRRVRTLVALRAALRPEGRVLLTYQPRRPGTSRIPSALARMAGALTGSDWRAELGDYVELSGPPAAPALHFEHRFSPAEAAAEAEAAGFRVLAHEQAAEGRVVLVRD